MDIFTYVDADRLAPDLPIPILSVAQERTNPGMAANVARNFRNLGHEVDLVTNENWESVTKNRFMHQKTNHAFIRIDRNDKIAPINGIPTLTDYDAVVISDYNKGFLSESHVAQLIQSHPRVFMDSKKRISNFAVGVEILKLNEYEFNANSSNLPPSVFKNTVITLGSAGARYRDQAFPVESVEVGDASGAGDAFFAQLVSSILQNYEIEAAIAKANQSARRVVEHRGVTTIEN